MEEKWITINGSHVLLNSKGIIVKGNKNITTNINNKNKDVKAKIIQKKVDENVSSSFEHFNKQHQEIPKVQGLQYGEGLKKLDEAWRNENIKYLSDITSEYRSTIIDLDYAEMPEKINTLGVTKFNDYNMSFVTLLNKSIDRKTFIDEVEKHVKSGWYPKIEKKNYSKYVLYHEFGHTLAVHSNKYQSELYKKIEPIYNEYNKARNELEKYKNEIYNNPTEEVITKAFEVQRDYDKKFISGYAHTSCDEFIAEAFADAKLNNNPSNLSIRVMEIIDKEYKR